MLKPSKKAQESNQAAMKALYEKGGEAAIMSLAKEEAAKSWRKNGSSYFHKSEEHMAENFFKGFMRDAGVSI